MKRSFLPSLSKVHEEWTPAPIRRRDTRERGNVAEDHVAVLRGAVVKLQHVDAVIAEESPASQFLVAGVGGVPAHSLSLAQVVWLHVHLRDVGPAVVVEIRDIDTHAREARVLQPLGALVRERSVAVVHVHDVVGRDVVRYIDVWQAIAVQISDSDARGRSWRLDLFRPPSRRS